LSTTELVAIIGAISTPAVAIAGYIFNERRADGDRVSTRELADDSHQHERELAATGQAHERQLRVGERLYEDRKATYRLVLRWALNTIHIVELTEPQGTYTGMPEPPEMIATEEYNNMQVELAAFGSTEVAEALDTFHGRFQEFANTVVSLRQLRAEHPDHPMLSGMETNVRDTRNVARSVYQELTALIRDELANL
jgi:hypothetical protein